VIRKQVGQQVRDDGPESHLKKQGTPTMGGFVIVGAVLLVSLLLCDLSRIAVWSVLIILLGYGLLGFWDDYQKVLKKNSKGVSARQKIRVQLGLSLLAVSLVYFLLDGFSSEIVIPYTKDTRIPLGILLIPFAALVVTGASNAVNLTDGLDGLVSGPVMTVAFAHGVIAYIAGSEKIAEYLLVPHIPGAGELAIIASAIVAACLGFLWYNSFPAEVFMGDVGALSLGGALGMIAVVTKSEIVLVISGGIFVIEALSVILQVASFKLRGKRVFRMAPIHHHFELSGLSEPKIIVRAWIISIVLSVVALLYLKVR